MRKLASFAIARFNLPVFRNVTIVGVGLLGGSLGLALKKRRLARKVTGFARRAATVAEARKLRALDDGLLDLRAAVKDADLVVLCTPLAQMKPLVKEMLPALKRGAVVTDVGSVKGSVVRELEALASKTGAHFVGSHPMAGAEKTGVVWARADLYQNAVCVVTPTRRTHRAALQKVEAFWGSIGSRVLRLSPEAHDALVSRSSHLPHVVAATLASLVLDPKWPKRQTCLCANGFRDTTRVASGSPEMWRDIVMANRGNLMKALGAFIGDLKTLHRTLQKGDARAVSQFFATAKARRDRWCAQCASPSPE